MDDWAAFLLVIYWFVTSAYLAVWTVGLVCGVWRASAIPGPAALVVLGCLGAMVLRVAIAAGFVYDSTITMAPGAAIVTTWTTSILLGGLPTIALVLAALPERRRDVDEDA